MAKICVSTTLEAPIERVWEVVRDFDGLPGWLRGIEASEIENGLSGATVGAVRRLRLAGDAGEAREKLLALSDLEHSFSYLVLEGPLPLDNLVATMRLRPVTRTGATYGEWSAEFDARPDQEQDGVELLSRVFASGWKSLARHLGG